MDHITKSLQNYLETVHIKYYTIQNEGSSSSETSTYFDITDISNNRTISILIDISPKNHNIFLLGYPHIASVNNTIENLISFENQWNKSPIFTTLNITCEKITEFDNLYSFQLSSRILSDANGLTRYLWGQYLKFLYEEFEQIWDFVSQTEE